MIYAGNSIWKSKISCRFLIISRFIFNIPSEQRDDAVRVLFAVETAHWFYIDFYYIEDNQLPDCHIRDFAQQSTCIDKVHFVGYLIENDFSFSTLSISS